MLRKLEDIVDKIKLLRRGRNRAQSIKDDIVRRTKVEEIRVHEIYLLEEAVIEIFHYINAKEGE